MTSTHCRAVIGVVFDARGRLLLGRKVIRPGQPFSDLWHLPGGKVEAGETDERAVVREVAEETGLHIVVIETLAESISADGQVWTWFLCVAAEGDPLAGGDLADASFVDRPHLPEFLTDAVTDHWPEAVRALICHSPTPARGAPR